MPEDVIKTSPESQDPSALQTAVYSYTHPNLGAIKIPYVANVEMPSYVAAITNSAAGANKNHVTFVNTSNRILRIRKIKVGANITGTIGGAIVMISVEGLSPPPATFPTGGTLITPRKMNTNFENLPTGIEIRAAPAANVNIFADYILDIGAIGVEEAVTTNNLNLELLKKDNEFSSLVLNTDQGIVIKQGTAAGAGALNFLIYFTLD